MATEPPEADDQPRKGRGPARGGKDDRKSAGRIATEAYTDYAREVRNAWTAADPAEEVPKAYERYVDRLREDWSPERTADLYVSGLRSYLRMVRGVIDPEQDSVAAYQKYVDELTEQWQPEERQERARDAYGDYLEALEEALAPEEFDRRLGEAWETYLGRLRDALAQLEGASAESEEVAAVAQSAAAAAALRGAATEAVRQRRTARDRVAAAPR